MKAFWWFRENSIAGIARPGFNAAHWFDLPFDEAVLLGWIGQFPSGSNKLDSFRNHLRTYAPKIYKFHKLNDKSGANAIRIFDHDAGFLDVLGRLNRTTQILNKFEIANDEIHLEQSNDRLKYEVRYLKERGIRTLVSLTEHQHNKEFLQSNFDLYHISIEDLNAPNLKQAQQLAEIIKESRGSNKGLVVHCLAGIGRTSTMLMAAHILMGESSKDLELLLKKQNPTYSLTGPQADFIKSLSTFRSN